MFPAICFIFFLVVSLSTFSQQRYCFLYARTHTHTHAQSLLFVSITQTYSCAPFISGNSFGYSFDEHSLLHRIATCMCVKLTHTVNSRRTSDLTILYIRCKCQQYVNIYNSEYVSIVVHRRIQCRLCALKTKHFVKHLRVDAHAHTHTWDPLM